MSILIVEFAPHGIVFAADRHVTVSRGKLQRQGEQRKVLQWPNRAAIVGYVGLGTIGEETTEEWLWAFVIFPMAVKRYFGRSSTGCATAARTPR